MLRLTAVVSAVVIGKCEIKLLLLLAKRRPEKRCHPAPKKDPLGKYVWQEIWVGSMAQTHGTTQ